MAERQINPLLKQVLELGPTIAFFLIYLRIKDDSFTIGGTEYSGFIIATLSPFCTPLEVIIAAMRVASPRSSAHVKDS